MEQLIFFVLGVVTVLLITGVVVTLRTQRKNLKLAEELKNLDYLTQREIEAIHRHVGELDRIFNSHLDKEIESVTREFDSVYRTIDSRADKLTARFENELKETNQFLAQINNKLK